MTTNDTRKPACTSREIADSIPFLDSGELEALIHIMIERKTKLERDLRAYLTKPTTSA